MRSTQYWIDREKKHILQQIKDEQTMRDELAKRYQDAIDAVEKEIQANWDNFMGKEGVSLTEAKQRAREMEIKAYERKAKKYVQDKDFSQKANDEMRLYNVTMRINRLELLKSQLGLELTALADELDKYVAELLTAEGVAEAKRQAGILGETLLDDYRKYVEAVVNSSFHSATFSERIWGNIETLRYELDRLLIRCIMQGKNPREIARELRNLFESSKAEAERLMRTESARVQSEIQMQSYKRYDIDEYNWVVEPSGCSICKAIAKDGPYKVSKAKIGVNVPPAHPNCRCSTYPIVDRDAFEQSLQERGV